MFLFYTVHIVASGLCWYLPNALSKHTGSNDTSFICNRHSYACFFIFGSKPAMLRTIEEEVAERNKALSKSTASSSDAPSSDHVCLVMFSSVHDLNEATCYSFKLLTDSNIEHFT